MKTFLLFITILLLGCVLLFLPCLTKAQAPEQDCSGAIVVTAETDSFGGYSGYGQSQEITAFMNTSCLVGGEQNSVWSIFTICDSGSLEFQIIPNIDTDDFDFALYDFITNSCIYSIFTNLELRCNYSALPGPTGLEYPYVLESSPSGGPPQCAPLHTHVGQRLLLLVNEYSDTLNGFTLTFGGTASICGLVNVPHITNSDKFFLYPNPTNGILQFKNLPAKHNLAIEVMNVYGNKVYEKELKGNDDSQLELPPLLLNGFYVLRILQEGKLFGEESFIISK